jgi:C4-dicarboxylate-specific signal transduction histidine kinase
MEHSPLSIAILTKDGKLNQVNTAWKNLWGLSEEETVQVMENYNIFTDKQMEHYGHAPLVVRAFTGEDIILPPMEYEGTRTAEEMALEGIKARSRWIQPHLYSVQDANGEIEYVVNINMDLTELKQAEKDAQSQRDVIARVGRTNSLGQLTGSLAHELNQPLTGILSNAQAAELMLQNNIWELSEMKEIMADIVNDTKRAGTVIQTLRDLYRKQELKFSPIDVNEIIQETIELLRSEFIMQRISIFSEPESNIPHVKGNKIQIQQVILNLLMNGYQAMEKSKNASRTLKVLTDYDEREVFVWIEDKGPGIDPEKIDSIFEPLATWKSGGTGMGLSISYSIILAHKGRMMAENKDEGGAKVGFALPSFIKK